MKTEIVNEKFEIKEVQKLRKIRDKINLDIENLSKHELVEYFKKCNYSGEYLW